MRIQINNKLLSDSPFSDSNKELFTPAHPSTDDLIKDIKYGTSTCYLISGYRGAGKSSFIKRIEYKIKEKEITKPEETNKQNQKNKKEEQQIKHSEVVFVHVNFSKYHNQTFLLRKLIRGLYLQIKDSESFKKMKNAEAEDPINQRTGALLEELYDKTFYDTANNITNSNKREVITIFNFDFLSFARYFLPPIFFILFLVNWVYKIVATQLLINGLGLGFYFLASIKGVIEISRKVTKSKTEQKDFIRKSLYDDEIADHHFFEILMELKNKNFKVIFVLDELDKVDDEDIDKLLKEMKPYLVSGAASFIAVAGQNLFYKYMQSKAIDDDVLSSIFSKFIHIPLFSREEIRGLFDRILINKQQHTDTEKKYLDSYIDYLIFESKKVPRKFISLIRQDLKWEETDSFIDIEFTQEELNRYTQILDIIEKINDEEIEAEGFDDGLRDYFVMQLFIKSHQILFSKKLNFSRSEILGQNGEQE
jgi:hypothetical protein